MKTTEQEETLKELSEKFNKKEKVMSIMFAEAEKMGYNILEFKNLINEFYNCY